MGAGGDRRPQRLILRGCDACSGVTHSILQRVYQQSTGWRSLGQASKLSAVLLRLRLNPLKLHVFCCIPRGR